MNWKNEIALITGASRGLGRALAEDLAHRGARVVLNARHPEPLAETVAAIRAEDGWAYGITADVSDVHAVYPLLAQAAEAAGAVTLLINNASTLGAVPLRAWLETEGEDLHRVLETNLVGPFRLTKAALGPMLLRGTGTIVNLSSDAASESYPNWGAYSVSKAALAHLTRTWAEELKHTPIRFFSFDPGEMDTVMHADAIPGADRTTLEKPDEVARRLIALLEENR
jgi:NAD(P)-dependent dehydrogenase (short-subunit alcohol dehydrogenase family)